MTDPTWVAQGLAQGGPCVEKVGVKVLILVQESRLFHHFGQSHARVAIMNGQMD